MSGSSAPRSSAVDDSDEFFRSLAARERNRTAEDWVRLTPRARCEKCQTDWCACLCGAKAWPLTDDQLLAAIECVAAHDRRLDPNTMHDLYYAARLLMTFGFGIRAPL
jgi:hypothetical protein